MEKYINTPNKFVLTQDGTKIAYRDYGNPKGKTLILLVHLAANMDNWQPDLLDILAENHRVIAFDYRGIGLSEGEQPLTIEQMAKDTLLFIKALHLEKVSILSLSMGGFVAQELVKLAPNLVEKLILTGTGIRGGRAVKDIQKIVDKHTLIGIFTLKDPKFYMFFNQDEYGKQKANEFLKSLKKRTANRDKSVSWKSYRRQLKAIAHWGSQPLDDLTKISQPTLIVNGDNDTIVPTEHSYTMANQIPNSQLIIYKNAGHGAIFQEYTIFADTVLNFLK